jgi:asparagine synthase (glutamine-hydrolysing)
MADTLQHRGPDSGGIWCDETVGVALGHRRLSILDLSDAGHQPMQSQSGRFVLSYNGEIYNFPEIQKELVSAGIIFRGHSDTEVLLFAIEHWGLDKTLQRINGMFAFALWDQSERLLTLVRDRVGKKPLYYGWCGKAFLFGSELKALAVHPEFNSDISRDALGQYIKYGWVPEPLSIYSNIRKLASGCLLRLPLNSPAWSIKPEPYWQAKEVCEQACNEPFSGSHKEATDQLDQLLTTSVADRMIADVDLGALLSGGIDSTTVVALMQKHSDRPVKTFSIGFNEPKFNEAGFAAEIAGYLGTEHHELYVTPQQCLDVVSEMPIIYDEPFADISQVPTLLVSRMAREGVTVVLTGDGGDELFGGYTHYFEALKQWRRIQSYPKKLRSVMSEAINTFAEFNWSILENHSVNSGKIVSWKRMGAKIQKRMRGLNADSPQALLLDRFARYATPGGLVLGAADIKVDLSSPQNWVYQGSPLLQMRQLDFIGYLSGDILVKVDRASMSTGLEVRCPMLDTRVVEFAWSLPDDYLIDKRGGKRVLRDVMNKYVPHKLTDRPKRGFGAPVEDWLRGPLKSWAEELLSEQKLKEQGLFNIDEVKTLWKQHMTGWRNHTNLLWALLMFQSWHINNGN